MELWSAVMKNDGEGNQYFFVIFVGNFQRWEYFIVVELQSIMSKWLKKGTVQVRTAVVSDRDAFYFVL